MRIRTLFAGASIAALLAALPAAAAGHAELESSDPQSGENLDAAPTEVTLTFSGELDPDSSSFTVVDADGHEVGSGEVDLTVADRNVMTGAVTITDPGVYTVGYTSLALDGDRVSGTFSFGYDADEAIPEPTAEEAPDTALPRPTTPPPALAGWLLLAAAGAIAVRRLALR